MSDSVSPRLAGVRVHIVAVAAVAALFVGACEQRQSPPLVHSETIGSLGKGYKKRSLAVSHDHRRLAWVDERGGRCRVVTDGEKGPWLEICQDPLFSRDGATIAYWGVPDPSDPPKGYLFVNGLQGSIAAGRDGPIAFSRHGGVWAAIAPAFDPDAPSIAEREAAARGEENEKGEDAAGPVPARRMVAFDARGNLGEHFDTTRPALSPDGSHVAYVAADAEGRLRLVVDGSVARAFERPEIPFLPVVKDASPQPNLDPESAVHYLADGSLVTVALAEQGYTVFHGDEVWASYPAVQLPKIGFEVVDTRLLTSRSMAAGTLATAADAPVACWWERLEGDLERWRVVCNGVPVDEQICDFYWAEFPITVAADGRSAAYVCRNNPPLDESGLPTGPPPHWVVVGGEKLGPHQFVWGIDLTADGRHYAYAAADAVDQPWFYVVDGKRFDGPWLRAYPPKLSPDGTSVVWAASREEEPKDKGENRLDLVVDGNVVARAEIVMAPPVFDGERKVQWAIKRGNSVRRLVVCTRWAPLELLRPLVCW